MEKTKLLILDFDGTLADTLPHVFQCVNKCVDKFGLRKIKDEDIPRFSGSFLEKILLDLGASEEQLPEIKKYYISIFMEDTSDIILFDGVKDTLSCLKKDGCKLAIATNRGRNTAEPLLEYLEIADMFDKVVCESDVSNKKPHPEMIEQILNDVGCNKTEAMMVGDTKVDIMIGKNSNVKTCLVSYKDSIDEEIKQLNPEYVINSFSDLNKIV